jgi:hypothetical protein
MKLFDEMAYIREMLRRWKVERREARRDHARLRRERAANKRREHLKEMMYLLGQGEAP